MGACRSRIAIDQLLAGDDGSVEPANGASTFAQLKADLGKSSRDNLLIGIERRQAINAIGLVTAVFKGIPPKFVAQFCQRCATESIRELRCHPAPIRYSMAAMFCWRRRQQLTDGLVDNAAPAYPYHRYARREEDRLSFAPARPN
jgi:hypothetical protein